MEPQHTLGALHALCMFSVYASIVNVTCKAFVITGTNEVASSNSDN